MHDVLLEKSAAFDVKEKTAVFVRLPWHGVLTQDLDNYGIHDSQQVQLALKSTVASKIRLHFLPPYCPDHNRIERTWKDLHDNVTAPPVHGNGGTYERRATLPECSQQAWAAHVRPGRCRMNDYVPRSRKAI